MHARTSMRPHMHATHTQHIEHWPVCGLAGVPPPPQTQAGCSTTAWSPAHPGCHSCTGGEPPWPGHSSHARSPPQSPTKSSAQMVNHLGQDIHHTHVLHRKVLQKVQHRRWTTLARTFITCTFSTTKSYKFSTDSEPPWPGHSSHARSPPQSPTTSTTQTVNHLGQDIHHVHVLYRNVLQVQHRRWTTLARTFITCTLSTVMSYKFSTDGEPPWPGHSSHARSPPQSPTSSAQTGNHLSQDIHHVHVLHRKVLQVQHRRWTTLARALITRTFSTAKSYKFSTVGQDIHHVHVLHRKVLQQVQHRQWTTLARAFITRTFSTAKSYKFSTDGEPPRPGHSSHARSPPQSPTTRTAKAAAACTSQWGKAQTGTSQRLVKDCFCTLCFEGCHKNYKNREKGLTSSELRQLSWASLSLM